MPHLLCGMDYRYGGHTIYQIEYHFVWVTKFRFKILKEDVAECVRELVRQTCEAFEIRVVQGIVSKDYVHILVNCPPEMVPSEIMRRIKGRTLSYLFEEFPYLKKYWGRRFCATVGQMTEEMIKQYLEHHFESNPNDNFKMEPEKTRRLVDAYPYF